MSAIVRALLDDLGPEDLAELARRLEPYIRPAAADDGWLDTKSAATYLGISVHALHRLTAQRQVPFTQHAPGAKCYFRRRDLDGWRNASGRRHP
jgi:hypothetical protein